MQKTLTIAGIALVLFAAGCNKNQQDDALAQGKAVVSKAEGIASSAWNSARDEAAKLSSDSGKSAIEAAKGQMIALRDKLSHVDAPSVTDSLRLDWVKDQIARLEAALTLQNIKEAMDRRVKIAMDMKENAEKSFQDVRNKLAETNAEYQDLQKKAHDAEAAYDNAADKVKDLDKKLQGQ